VNAPTYFMFDRLNTPLRSPVKSVNLKVFATSAVGFA